MNPAACAWALIGLTLVASATGALATSISAPMGVTVTVIRSCAISTGAVPRLTLACSSGVTQVTVLGDGSPPEVRVFAGEGRGLRLTYPMPRRNTASGSRPDTGQPRRVTLNF